MFDALLHVGADQPAGGWILVASLLSFVAGLGLGLSSGRLRERVRPEREETADGSTD